MEQIERQRETTRERQQETHQIKKREKDKERERERDIERERERQSNRVENLCKVASTSNALAKADALGLPPPW